MQKVNINNHGEIVPSQKLRFNFWKLGVLAIFSYYLIKIALSFDVNNPNHEADSFLEYVFYNTSVMPHEFGHYLFNPYGKFMTVIGGTILQILIPLFCVVYFLFTRQFFSMALTVSWLGENIIFVSIYMATAITMEGEYYIPSLGSVSKESYPGLVTDWNYIFNYFGVLGHTAFIAQATYYLGFLIVLAGIILGIWGSRKMEDEF